MGKPGSEPLTLAAEATDPTLVDPRATIRPEGSITFDESLLPTLPFEGEHAEFERLGVLGAGGMGVVERALQRSLDREVAIKQARDPNPRLRTAMMREARIAGRLEHPGIVPVHALGRDERGEAVIVMKKVSGASWLELLEQPEHRLWGEGDRLLRNLEIFVAVCHAVELAHARGWLHRDLKTENVMVGEFGEVYVLDWGIAVRIDVAAAGEAGFGGTPAYMAPEMAAGGALTTRTDIYLLGGMLYEALCGRAPNDAPTPRQMMAKVLIDRSPRRPPHVAPELQDIVARAMAYHSDERFEDVAALRAAIGEFVVHRDALQIANRADALLDRVASGASEDPRAELADARASFRNALALWPQSDRARDGLDRTLDALCELELEDGNPSAAAAWAAQRSRPSPALDARIAREHEAREREARELAALRDEASERNLAEWARDHRVRIWLYAASFTVVGFLGGALLRAGVWTLGFLELGIINGVFLAATLVSVHLGSVTNAMSRKMAMVMVHSALSPFASMAIAAGLGLTAAQSMPIDLFVKTGGSVMLGLFVLPAFTPSAFAIGVAAGLLVAFPSYPLEITATGLAIGFVIVARGAGSLPTEEKP